MAHRSQYLPIIAVYCLFAIHQTMCVIFSVMVAYTYWSSALISHFITCLNQPQPAPCGVLIAALHREEGPLLLVATMSNTHLNEKYTGITAGGRFIESHTRDYLEGRHMKLREQRPTARSGVNHQNGARADYNENICRGLRDRMHSKGNRSLPCVALGF